MEEQTRSLSEVAGVMGVSERTVRRWIKSGRLKAYKPGRDYRIPESGLRAFIEESEISPKVPAPPSSEPTLFNGVLDEERRANEIDRWKDYVAKRVEWCEQVMDKAEGDFIYPFGSLDTAIQWAMYVGIESVQLSDFITHGGGEDNQDLRALVDRLVSVSERTDARVKVMMEDAALNAEEREQVNLRLVQGQQSA